MGFKIGLLGAVGGALMVAGCVTESDQPLVVPQKQGEKATIDGHRHYGAPIDVPVLMNRDKDAKVVPKGQPRPGTETEPPPPPSTPQ